MHLHHLCCCSDHPGSTVLCTGVSVTACDARTLHGSALFACALVLQGTPWRTWRLLYGSTCILRSHFVVSVWQASVSVRAQSIDGGGSAFSVFKQLHRAAYASQYWCTAAHSVKAPAWQFASCTALPQSRPATDDLQPHAAALQAEATRCRQHRYIR